VLKSVVVAGVIALAAVGVSGCGGGNDDNAANGTTATVPANTRLDAASWATYVSQREKAQAVNRAATKTFAKCRELAQPGTQPQQIRTCLGDAPTKVVSEGQQVISTLEGFQDEVSGACLGANKRLSGYVRSYIATINAIDQAIDRGNAVAIQQQFDQANRALAGARTSIAAFEAACKPGG
jgi:hypothetical protein